MVTQAPWPGGLQKHKYSCGRDPLVINVSSAVTFPLTRAQLQAAFSSSHARRQLSSLSCGLACMAAPKVLPDPPVDTKENSPPSPVTPKASSKLRRFHSEPTPVNNTEDAALANLGDSRTGAGPRRLRSILGLVSCAVPRDQEADDDIESVMSEVSFAGGDGYGLDPAARGGATSLLGGRWTSFRKTSFGSRKLSLVACAAKVKASVVHSSCRGTIPVLSELVLSFSFPSPFLCLSPHSALSLRLSPLVLLLLLLSLSSFLLFLSPWGLLWEVGDALPLHFSFFPSSFHLPHFLPSKEVPVNCARFNLQGIGLRAEVRCHLQERRNRLKSSSPVSAF